MNGGVTVDRLLDLCNWLECVSSPRHVRQKSTLVPNATQVTPKTLVFSIFRRRREG
jgi:hypothetical protein